MRRLIELHDELIALYGYQSVVSSAFGIWNKFLKGQRNNKKDQKMFFGREEPNDPHAKYQYVQYLDVLIQDSKTNGIHVNTHRRSVVVLIHAIWEDQYRQRIAYECGLSNKNRIESDVFHDVNKYRQAVLHAGGRLVGEPKVIRFFKHGDEVLLTDAHMNELFSLLMNELNRIGKIYYDQDPGFRLDKPLNNPSSNRSQK